jgi:hypothetical protein
VTVPQRSTASKAIVLSVLLVFIGLAAPVRAQEDDDHQTLFSCGTDPVNDQGWLDLSGIPQDDGSWTDLRFERHSDTDGQLVYSFPPDGVDYRTAFLFSHSRGPGGYLVTIRWVDQGTDYVYYSLAIPPNPEIEDDMGGGDAGLAISKDGELIERVSCAERPYMFISYMQESMSCDLANPHGEAACADDTYDHGDEIDTDTIGIVP